MIPQYTAASIVSQNKQYCTPASVDSIVSSNGQEDHVSMGANAAVKCAKVVENVYTILGIELLNGMQALDFRKPTPSSPIIEKLRMLYRENIAFIDDDVMMYPEINKSVAFIKQHNFTIPSTL
jgi:histidine ammonia-lyase